MGSHFYAYIMFSVIKNNPRDQWKHKYTEYAISTRNRYKVILNEISRICYTTTFIAPN